MMNELRLQLGAGCHVNKTVLHSLHSLEVDITLSFHKCILPRSLLRIFCQLYVCLRRCRSIYRNRWPTINLPLISEVEPGLCESLCIRDRFIHSLETFRWVPLACELDPLRCGRLRRCESEHSISPLERSIRVQKVARKDERL